MTSKIPNGVLADIEADLEAMAPELTRTPEWAVWHAWAKRHRKSIAVFDFLTKQTIDFGRLVLGQDGPYYPPRVMRGTDNNMSPFNVRFFVSRYPKYRPFLYIAPSKKADPGWSPPSPFDRRLSLWREFLN